MAASAVACGGVQAFASSTFDNDDEGWTIAGDADPTPELSGSAGNPGGHICATDQVGGDIWYFIAPQKFLGDASRVYDDHDSAPRSRM